MNKHFLKKIEPQVLNWVLISFLKNSLKKYMGKLVGTSFTNLKIDMYNLYDD